MICHQGSARASPRLRQLCQQPKVSPHTQRNAFHLAPYPKKPHGAPEHPPHGVCSPAAGQPPGGHCHRHPLAGLLSRAWDIGKTPSIPPPPRQKLRLWEGGPRTGWEQTAQMSRAARQAPAAAVRGCCPVSKATPLWKERPRRARMPPGPPAAAEPIGDGGFRRVFQTSA